MDNMTGSTVKDIMSRVFGVPAEDITDESSPETIAAWDSMQHINLIFALEEEFGIKFETDDFIGMTTFGKVVDAVAGKI